MKLPDFFSFSPLNALKSRMGIPQDVYGTLEVAISSARLSEFELERLASSEGLDVSLDDVVVLPDGTLAYKNSRVLLYIRDVSDYGGREFQPRYHLSNCATLANMRSKNKFNRYVVSTRLDGRFTLNVISSGRARSGLHELSVCQNCLDRLHFDGFALELPPATRRQHVKSFKLERFFEKYPASLHVSKPRFNADNAPLNTYTPDFPAVSEWVKERCKWTCSRCSINLSSNKSRKYLHVHHRNTQKWDNDDENLQVLCIRCHAEQPDHQHLKASPDYAEFLRLNFGPSDPLPGQIPPPIAS